MAETTPIYLDEFKAMHPADLADPHPYRAARRGSLRRLGGAGG